MKEGKKSALNWLMAEYGYKYSRDLANMAKCVQAYADYCKQFDSDAAREALEDVLKELSELTGLSRQVGYSIQLRHLKALLKREAIQ